MHNLRSSRWTDTIAVPLLFIAILATQAWAQNRKTVMEKQYGNLSKIRRVYVNLKGDPKQAQRLWTFISFELEDVGIQTVETEKGSDAVINGEVSNQVEQNSLGLAIIRTKITTDGKEDVKESCGSMSTDADGALFDSTPKEIAKGIRDSYPKARSVRIDAAGDTGASETFTKEFPAWLRSEGLSIEDSGTTDLLVRVDLSRVKVPLEQRTVRYSIKLEGRDDFYFTKNDSIVLSTILTGPAPAQCPDRLSNLKWMTSFTSLYQVAHEIATDLQERNASIK
jgi:hypothetical protein